MDQAQLEIELGAWKNIAIDKQVLLSDVYSALGLDEQSSNDELKNTLKKMISRAQSADDQIKTAQTNVETIKLQLDEMKKELAKAQGLKNQAEQAQTTSANMLDEAKSIEKKAEERLQASKLANAEELKKINNQLKDKQKEIKQIHKILADSPENVVKKLKNLNKEKFDESTLRKQAEAESRNLRKQLKTSQKENDANKEQFDKAETLIEQLNSFKEVANNHLSELKAANADNDYSLPTIDQELIDLFAKKED